MWCILYSDVSEYLVVQYEYNMIQGPYLIIKFEYYITGVWLNFGFIP